MLFYWARAVGATHYFILAKRGVNIDHRLERTYKAFVRHIFEIRGLKKVYQSGQVAELVFESLDLDIEESSFVAVTGPSGSGKSSLLNLIGLMDEPTEGEIVFESQKLGSLAEEEKDKIRRFKFGFIFQNFNLLSAMNVFENVGLSLLTSSLSEAEKADRIVQSLEVVGMGNYKDKFPDMLSGGQRQRVAIARAFVHRPRVIIADEPSASLDRKNSELILDAIDEMKRLQGSTVVMASHDEVMYSKADRVLRLEGGKFHAQ